jgi:hypothetical protein
MNPLYDYPFDDINDQAIDDQAMMQNWPGGFTSVIEAFPSALSLITSSLLLLRRCAKYTIGETLPPSTAREQATLTTVLARWNKAFHPILMEARQNMTSRLHLKALELHISVVAAEIIVSSTIYREEIMFDKFTPQFQYISSTCRCVLEKEPELQASGDPKSQFSGGLIMLLYYAATRCRDPAVRWDAIAVLKEWPSRHGIWDSWQAAKVAEWIVSIEELGCDSDGFIPEERRVRITSLNVEIHGGGRVTVECTQGSVHHVLKHWKVDLL